MKKSLLGIILLISCCGGAEIRLSSPLDYQVVQRSEKERGTLAISGKLADFQEKGVKLQSRIIRAGGSAGEWQALGNATASGEFSGSITVPAGGWFRLEVRALDGPAVLAESAVEHVGIGEIFVVAGQSNSANHGEEKQTPASGRVVSFDGQRWQPTADPQPGAGGGGGSFMPPLGDALVKRLDVPVAFIACGIGATSVREWLPEGGAFPAPPTLTGRVKALPDGRWASDGEAFAMLVSRMKQAGPQGFRAVLWHQGESDANQADSSRTLPGKLYRDYLETLIRESRKQIARDVPWFVAQASYHVPGDESSPDIRAAQASLWKDGIALEGPDTDTLKGNFRENGGRGIHFSGKGLRAHAALWESKIAPWLERQLE